MLKRATRTAITAIGVVSAGAVLLAAFQNCAPTLPSDSIDYASLNAEIGKRPSPTPRGPNVTPPPTSTAPPTSITWEGICTDNFNLDSMAVSGVDRSAAYVMGFTKADGAAALWSFNPNDGVYRGQVCRMTTAGWKLAAIGDFNADFNTDVVWRNTTDGQVVVWLMIGAERYDGGYIGTADANWKLEAAVDVTGDRKADLIWRNASSGAVAVWQMNGKLAPTAVTLDTTIEPNYALVGTGLIYDLSVPFKNDLIWRSNDSGRLRIWNIDGGAVTHDIILNLGDGSPAMPTPVPTPASSPTPTPAPTPELIGTAWNVRAIGDFDGDNLVDIMWQKKGTREIRIWKIGADRKVVDERQVAAPVDGWSIQYSVGAASFIKKDVLWVIPSQNGPLPGIMGMSLVPNGSLRTLNPIRENWSVFKYDHLVVQPE